MIHATHATEALQLPLGSAVAIETHRETFYVQRQSQQWRLLRLAHAQPFCSLQAQVVIAQNVEVPVEAVVERSWMSGEQESTLRVLPCMTDKNLMLSLETPIVIPAGRRPKFYLQLPIMYQLYIGNAKAPFFEFLIEPLPLSWFGSNTRRGELCYKFHSEVLSEYEQAAPVPHRALLELRLCNRDGEHLSIDKLNIPAQYLPIYRVDGRQFWTTALTITNEKLTEGLSLHYSKAVPCRHDSLQLVNESRLRSEARTIMRALEAIIG